LLDNVKQKRIEGLLLAAWNDAREKLRNPTTAQEMPSYTHILTDGTLGFIIGSKGIAMMNEIMEIILSEEAIGRRFSSKYLRKEFDNLLSDLLKANPRGIQKETNNLVTALIQKLIITPNKTWKVAIPIVNLVLRQPSFSLGHIVFANYESDICRDLMIFFRKSFQNIPTTEEVKQYMISTIGANYENHVIGIINVSAVDGEQALMIGIEEIELALYTILFYGRATLHNDIISYRMYIGRKGYIFKSQFVGLSLLEIDSNIQEPHTTVKFLQTGYSSHM
jgi:hypothetical protein